MRKRTIILYLFFLTSLAIKSEAAEPVPAAQAARKLASCGEWEQAIKSYSTALSATPDDAVCLARRGYAYVRIGNYKQAFADFDGAIKCDTNCADAYYGRSRLYESLGLHDSAKKDAQKALGLILRIPKDPVALLEHVFLLQCAGLIAQNSTNASFYRRRADCYINQKNWENALKDAQQVISLDPLDGYILQAVSMMSLVNTQWHLANTIMPLLILLVSQMLIPISGRPYLITSTEGSKKKDDLNELYRATFILEASNLAVAVMCVQQEILSGGRPLPL